MEVNGVPQRFVLVTDYKNKFMHPSYASPGAGRGVGTPGQTHGIQGRRRSDGGLMVHASGQSLGAT